MRWLPLYPREQEPAETIFRWLPLWRKPTASPATQLIDSPKMAGNGIGYQRDLAYTLTATDHHAVFRRQRVDLFQNDVIAGTQSARQHKDATDLVFRYLPTKKDIVYLIRRLIPLECERLQGYPDGWIKSSKGTDSNRYKALGNSVAIPCVQYLINVLPYVLCLGFRGIFSCFCAWLFLLCLSMLALRLQKESKCEVKP